MVEAAVHTTVSTGSVWLIVVVASVVLVIWLSSIFLADRAQVRLSTPGPTSRRGWVGGSAAGQRAADIPGEVVLEPVGTRAGDAGDEPVPAGEVPTRADLPAQRGPAEPRPAMPRQRTGQADRAERSHAAPERPDEEPGR